MQSNVIRVKTSSPAKITLATMGRVAQEASRTWTLQHWARRLATKAPPRDYVAQLGALYDGIVNRWRYVREPGETIYGSSKALLGYGLGAYYNRSKSCPNPLQCDVGNTTWREHGHGDCDDVTALATAGALALGMPQVLFRVASFPGGSHVSPMVKTPRGQWVSLDPVGHPDKKFGWALEPSMGTVRYFDLDGRPVSVDVPHTKTSEATVSGATYMSGPEGEGAPQAEHMVLVEPGDTRGPRTLGMPAWNYRLMQRGVVLDGMPAVDEYGDQYGYDADNDLWLPMGSRFSRRRKARKERRQKRRARRRKRRQRVKARIAKAARRIGRSRIAKAFRKAKHRILTSRIVQETAAQGLKAFGIPPRVTKGILEREADLAKRGGRAKIVELLAAGKKREAAKMIAAGFVKGVKSQIPGQKQRKKFGGFGELGEGGAYVICQQGATYHAAPVAEIVALSGVVELGQIEAQTTVQPGTFYKIQRGDNLLKIGQRLNEGKRSGGPYGSRTKAAQLINRSAFNRRFYRPTKAGFEENMFGPDIISLNPKFSDNVELAPGSPAANSGNTYATIWIPPAEGVEPPDMCPGGTTWDGATGTCTLLPEPEPVEPEIPDVDEEPPIVVEEPPEPEIIEPVVAEPVVVPPTPVPPMIPTPPPIVEPPPPPPVIETPVQRPRECPQWFTPSPTDPSVCRPVECPPGMAWKSVAQGGPRPLGGCVKTPAECPPGTVWSSRQSRCIRVLTPPKPPIAPPPEIEPTRPPVVVPPPTLPPPVVTKPPIAPPPEIEPTRPPVVERPPPSAKTGKGAFPFLAMMLFLAR